MPILDDYGDDIRNHGEHLGRQFSTGGPKALLEEMEQVVPESWREQVVKLPVSAMVAGVVAGLVIGFRMADEVLAAGSAMVGAATAAHVRHLVSSITDRHSDDAVS